MNRLGIIIVAVVFGAQCQSSPMDALPQGEPNFRGTVTAKPAPREGYDYYIESRPGEPEDEKVYIRVDSGTRFLKRVGSRLSPVSQHAIGVGTHVEVWVAGVILDSYPQQATAAVVLIPDVFFE